MLLGEVAAAERTGAVGLAPLAELLHALAAEDRGGRRGDPAGLEVGRRVGARARRQDAELRPCVEHRAAHGLALLPGAEQLEARLAGHAVTQRADLESGDRQLGQMEELDLGWRRADQLLDDLHRARPLHLVAEQPRRPAGPLERVLVAFDGDVVAAAERVVVDPVDERR